MAVILSVEAEVLLATSSASFPWKETASRLVSPCTSVYDIMECTLDPSPIPSAISAAVAVYCTGG
jgi:hypothetical protein